MAEENGLCWLARLRSCGLYLQGNLGAAHLLPVGEGVTPKRAGSGSSLSPLFISWICLLTSSHATVSCVHKNPWQHFFPSPAASFTGPISRIIQRSRASCLKVGFGVHSQLQGLLLCPVVISQSVSTYHVPNPSRCCSRDQQAWWHCCPQGADTAAWVGTFRGQIPISVPSSRTHSLRSYCMLQTWKHSREWSRQRSPFLWDESLAGETEKTKVKHKQS